MAVAEQRKELPSDVAAELDRVAADIRKYNNKPAMQMAVAAVLLRFADGYERYNYDVQKYLTLLGEIGYIDTAVPVKIQF